MSSYLGPTGFEWAVPGELGGAPRPGIRQDIERDIEALKRIGTTILITLQAEWEPPVDLLCRLNIESLHVRIPDMGVPSLDSAISLVDEVERRISEGGTAVYHCHGGRGRTGTLLACHLVRRGLSGQDAIRKVRERNPHWIESERQEIFVHNFHERVAKGIHPLL